MSTGIHFDMTISFANVLMLITMIVGAVGAVFTIRGMVNTLGVRMNNVEETQRSINTKLEKIETLLVTVAVQDTRLNAQAERMNLLDKRYEELSHWRGFVNPVPVEPRMGPV